MHINRTENDSVAGIYRASRRRRVDPTDPSAPLESVEAFVASPEGMASAELASAVLADPLYREALVNELARRVAEGKYFVPSEQIVEKLLGRLVAEAQGS